MGHRAHNVVTDLIGPDQPLPADATEDVPIALPLRHPGSLMTLDEWIALPEDNTYRYELQESVLLVSPEPFAAISLPPSACRSSLMGSYRCTGRAYGSRTS